MIYRLLAINIDGTLLQNNGRLHKSTKEAIDYVRDKGIYVTLVTSRSFPSAKKVAKALKLDSILITHRGAYIADELEQPLLERRIPEDICFEIVRLLEGFQCQIRLVHEKYSLANKQKLANNLLAKTVVSSGDPLHYPHQFVDRISESLMDDPVAPPKMEVYFEHTQDLADTEKALAGMYSEINTLKITPNQLEIVPHDVSKLTGLLYLGNKLGIKRNEMVVIGDNLDDLEMIESVGLGVAMGNAPVEVKLAADWVTRSNQEQGVSYMVREHFRKQHPIEFLRKMNIIQ